MKRRKTISLKFEMVWMEWIDTGTQKDCPKLQKLQQKGLMCLLSQEVSKGVSFTWCDLENKQLQYILCILLGNYINP